ncbi:MAG TPA: hypothetical protein VJQ59_17800 [Candidatus Sulfotelmatobacter sp.]|nr:hypothetical protein [Candidatus Sulfotelmatobacter sp.]
MRDSSRRTAFARSRRTSLPGALIFFACVLAAHSAIGQAAEPDKPVPILTGNIGTFSFVTGGQNLIDTQINPVLLVPLGDKWLVESRAEFEGQFQRPQGGGPYQGPVAKHVDYAQLDYIANPHLTVTIGRFLTPFGIFNERLYPVWIRFLQPDPLILPINTAPSDGAMFRGGFPVSPNANMNYAFYASTTSIGIDSVDSERHVGGRIGFFFPGPRLEVGGSWQRTLQDDRKNAFGFHMGWQPSKLPLSVRSEFARSFVGSGYWVESAYRLSQVHFWHKAMRRTELVGRAQQFFVGAIGADAEDALELPSANTREADFGVNYFFRDGMKGIASYGRQFSSAGNFNQWSFGLAYRFLVPLGRVADPQETQ